MSENHIKELRDVAFRKIGRNLVNFQKLELALKFIIARSDLRGYASEAAKVLQDKEKVADRKAQASSLRLASGSECVRLRRKTSLSWAFLKLRRVMERKGFQIVDIDGVGKAYYQIHEIG